jgi:hypothetical protein
LHTQNVSPLVADVILNYKNDAALVT